MQEQIELFNKWCSSALTHALRPFTAPESNRYVGALAAEGDTGVSQEKAELQAEFDTIPAYQLMVRRSAIIGFTCTFEVYLWLMTLCSGHPGNIVMYLYILRSYQKEHKHSLKFTVGDFAQVFPLGVLTDEALEEIWTTQKMDSGNLLDSSFVAEYLRS